MSAVAWVAVGLIGGVAAGARFLLDFEVSLRTVGPFPAGILAVNLLGALALGMLAGSGIDGQALTVLGAGLVGSFTTFSTWMLDTHRLHSANLPRLAWANLAISQLAGFGAFALGHWIAH
ncbi:MAG TPA: fluoride efflux transporter CrcB [Solirubrobacterales bacterium]|nr:fluoride efflux transporter CrcB [Solirubrobacterales bacterium]